MQFQQKRQTAVCILFRDQSSYRTPPLFYRIPRVAALHVILIDEFDALSCGRDLARTHLLLVFYQRKTLIKVTVGWLIDILLRETAS